jgi:predicted lipoprotein with Yx(FWY)xxD motif
MKFLTKRILFVLAGCALLLVLGACSTSQTEQNPSPVTSSYGSTTSTATALTNTFGVKVALVNVKGKVEPVLTNEQGRTLYTFKPDTATKTACTGKCAVTWPPQLAKQVGQMDFGQIGSLSAVQDANGIQVQANGHFLYTFSKDTAAGQANGQGVAGKWFVATPMSA